MAEAAPSARRRCPACGADAFVASQADAGAGSCSRCGYVAGEALRCPHCRAVARIDGEGRRAVCAACGGPRIPSGLGGKASTDALREQKRALDVARLSSIAASSRRRWR